MPAYRYTAPGRVQRVTEGAASELVDPLSTADQAARAILSDAESERLQKPRPPQIATAIAAAFAEDRLRSETVEITREEVLAWIDGPGLAVILESIRDYE